MIEERIYSKMRERPSGELERGPSVDEMSAEPRPQAEATPGSFRLVKLRQNESTGDKKLGFSLRGGKEATGSSVGVFVSHVELAGQASKNGLRVGDQLIQVNGLQVSRATYEEVIELIKRAPKCDEICLLVRYVGRIPFQERTGQPIRWLEIKLTPDQHHHHHQAVSEFYDDKGAPRGDGGANPLTAGDHSHLLLLDDLKDVESNCRRQLLVESSTTTPTKLTTYQDDSAVSSQSLTLTSSSSSSFSSGASIGACDEDEGNEEIEEEEEAEMLQEEEEEDECGQLVAISSATSSADESSSSGCSISMSSVQSSSAGDGSSVGGGVVAVDEATPIRVLGGRRTSEPFGCGVVKGPEEWPGIFVQNVKRASLAERSGLEPGDQLVRAGNFELSEMPFEAAIATIKRLQQQQDELLLMVRKGAALKHLAECKQHNSMAAAAAAAAVRSSSDLSQKKPHGTTRAQAQQQVRTTRGSTRAPLEPPPAPPARQTTRNKQQVAQLNGNDEDDEGEKKPCVELEQRRRQTTFNSNNNNNNNNNKSKEKDDDDDEHKQQGQREVAQKTREDVSGIQSSSCQQSRPLAAVAAAVNSIRFDSDGAPSGLIGQQQRRRQQTHEPRSLNANSRQQSGAAVAEEATTTTAGVTATCCRDTDKSNNAASSPYSSPSSVNIATAREQQQQQQQQQHRLKQVRPEDKSSERASRAQSDELVASRGCTKTIRDQAAAANRMTQQKQQQQQQGNGNVQMQLGAAERAEQQQQQQQRLNQCNSSSSSLSSPPLPLASRLPVPPSQQASPEDDDQQQQQQRVALSLEAEDALRQQQQQWRQQAAPASRHPCSSPIVAQKFSSKRHQQQQQQQVANVDDYDSKDSTAASLANDGQRPPTAQRQTQGSKMTAANSNNNHANSVSVDHRHRHLNADEDVDESVEYCQRSLSDRRLAHQPKNARKESIQPQSRELTAGTGTGESSPPPPPQRQLENKNQNQSKGSTHPPREKNFEMSEKSAEEAHSRCCRQVESVEKRANADDDDDQNDQLNERNQEEEEIKIVKQNCKLHHHNSTHSLVNSKLFLSNASSIGCNISQQQQRRQQQKQQQSDLNACQATKVSGAPAKAHRAPQPPVRSLQRYVSMDNLRSISSPPTTLIHQQQQQQQQLVSSRYKRLTTGAEMRDGVRQKVGAPPLSRVSAGEPPELQSSTSPFYRRSNSVLSQPLACCPLQVNHLQQQQQQLVLLASRAQKQLLLAGARNAAATCHCQDCDNNLYAYARMQAAPATSSMQKSNIKHAARCGGGTPAAISARQSHASVSLSKFKARSVDKLNLMSDFSSTLNYQTTCTSGGGNSQARLMRMQQAKLISEHQQAAVAASLMMKRQQQQHQHESAWLAHQQRLARIGMSERIGASPQQLKQCCSTPPQQQQHQLIVNKQQSTKCCNHSQAVAAAAAMTMCTRANVVRQQQASKALVYNYATTTGMISTRQHVASAVSCCAIDKLDAAEELAPLECCKTHRTGGTSELWMLEQQQQDKQRLLITQKHRRLIASQASGYSLPGTGCCYCQQQSAIVMPTAANQAPASQFCTRTTRSSAPKVPSACGASTDSSGYASATSERRRQQQQQLSSTPTPSQQRDARGARLTTFTSPQVRPTSEQQAHHLQQQQQQQQQKTTVMVPHRLQANMCATPSIEISSCGTGSLGSTCSPASSGSSSCSPLSSPLDYLSSSTSSCVSTAARTLHSQHHQLARTTAGHYEVSGPPTAAQSTPPPSRASPHKPRLLRGKLLSSACPEAQLVSDIPRPPPMPLPDDSLTLRAPPTLRVGGARNVGEQKRRISTTSSESVVKSKCAPPPSKSSNSNSNKLCFVDELKMLASQSAASSSINHASHGTGEDSTSTSTSGGGGVASSQQAHHNQHLGESATLIKIINANKLQSSKGVSAGGSSSSNNNNRCSCCASSTSSVGSRAECARSPSHGRSSLCGQDLKCGHQKHGSDQQHKVCCYKSSAGGASACQRARAPPISKKTSADGGAKTAPPSKSVQLRDDEYTKRRQHELLMEEFKTAHSKMFNKLRQKQQTAAQTGTDVDELERASQANDDEAYDDHHHANGGDNIEESRALTGGCLTGNLTARTATTIATS